MNHQPIPSIIATGCGWLVVDKPYGMSVHNDPGRDLCSVILKQVRDDPKLALELKLDNDFGVNPVHRLDKMTSGVILLALTQPVFRYFTDLFDTHQIEKRYLAIVHGNLKEEPSDTLWHTWSYHLAINAGGRKDPIGRGKKQESVTHYRVIVQTKNYTLIECRLVTGRKHQIRRHAKKAGHPVVGDRRYGSLRAVKYLAENHHFDRLGLHAASLAFTPPEEKNKITVSAGDLPAAMQALL